jgi:hypothetical protein
MLIEYKIKFEKDGLTIAQHIEPNSSPLLRAGVKTALVNSLPAAQNEVGAVAPANPLAQVAADSGGGEPIEGGGGGGIPGGPGSSTSSAPIFILGPIVFANAAPPELAKPVEPTVADTTPKALGTTAGK